MDQQPLRFPEDRTLEEFAPSHLISEYSPSLPYDFPKELIPSFSNQIYFFTSYFFT